MSCTIQISYEVIYSWHEVFFPLDCFIRLPHMSTQIRTSPDFLGTTTMELVQGVGPSTHSMISNLSNFQAPFQRLHAHERESCDVAVVWV